MTATKSAHSLAMAVLLALPILYAGSYYAMLCPQEIIAAEGPVMRIVVGRWYHPDYRIKGEVTECAFFPMHCVDRWIRQRHWRCEAVDSDLSFYGGASEVDANDPEVQYLINH